MKQQSSLRERNSTARALNITAGHLLLAVLFVALALTTATLGATVSASTPHSGSIAGLGRPGGAADVQAAAALTGTKRITSTVGATNSGSSAADSAPPGAVATAPRPQQTGQVPPVVPTGGAGGAGPASGSTGSSGTAGQSGGNSGNSFPWLPVIILAVVILAAIAFFLFRPRRPVTAAATSGAALADGAAAASAGRRASTTTTSTTAYRVPTTGPAAAAAATGVAASNAPSTVECPNCHTVNDINENFCKECGQDLRQARAAAIAAAAPPVEPEVVTDDMPYLETLDRVDEQLEYVLSRRLIRIGTDSSNDIVIDAAFKGYRSVSPVHAELRREQDGFLLVDRNSENGTFVNEMRTGENVLADGDQIRVGDVRFIYHVPTE